MGDCNIDKIISKEINFVAKLDFEDCVLRIMKCLPFFQEIVITTFLVLPEIILPLQTVFVSKLT